MSEKNDIIDGKADQTSGSLKEKAGDLLDDEQLKDEGTKEQIKGNLKEARGHLKEAVKSIKGD